jgi:hypothetical protein
LPFVSADTAKFPSILQVACSGVDYLNPLMGLLTCHGIRETINAEHRYGALMASARTDLQKAEKRQSFGSEIR